MGRPKGGKNRDWTVEAKYEIIKPILDGLISIRDRAKETNVFRAMINKWLGQYHKNGIAGLENKRKPGNPLAKYSNRKELTELEKLQYENMKLRIENERLKKGYTKKEADQAKQKKSSKKNIK